jgi:hypothetical protein
MNPLAEMRRGLKALHLEAPQSVVQDVTRLVEAALVWARDQAFESSASVAEAYAEADQDSSCRAVAADIRAMKKSSLHLS